MTHEPGGSVIAQLRFESPVFVLADERFILRDWAEQTTLAGGIVLDADPVRQAFRKESQRRFLESREDKGCQAFIQQYVPKRKRRSDAGVRRG